MVCGGLGWFAVVCGNSTVPVFNAMIIIVDLPFIVRSSVVKKGVFQSVQMIYFKELTCQSKQCVYKMWMI